ncbi:hypothetical protein [Thiolapillus sp.]
MKKPVVLFGIGEMGSVFAQGFLRLGHPVYPILHDQDMATAATEIPEAEAALIAVGKQDLPPMLEKLPVIWQDKIILLQNELLPADFAAWPQATIVCAWFEKKPGTDFRVIMPSPCFGPKSALVKDALGKLDIPVSILNDQEQLLFELVVKNLYILTTSIASLKTSGNARELWTEHGEIVHAVANDIISLQESLTGKTFNQEALMQAMLHAFESDPEHQCSSHNAPAHLQHALDRAEQQNIDLPTLVQLASEMH